MLPIFVLIHFVFYSVVVILLVLRKKVQHLPLLIKICIGFFFFEGIDFLYASFGLIFRSFAHSNTFRVTYTIGGLIFAANHWTLTSHYLKVACIFKFSFGVNLDSAIAKIKEREKLLLYLNITVYSFLIAIFIVMMVLREDSKIWNILYFSQWTFLLLGMATINLLSMRHILKKSKPLERYGIYENVLIMRLYCIFWIAALFT